MSNVASAGIEKHFRVGADSVVEARQFVMSSLAGTEVDRDDLAVLTSEVATNAVRHANTDFRVRVRVIPEAVRVEVINDAPEMLLIKRDPSLHGGRGLHILDSLALDWGVEARDEEKIVWFELPRLRGAPGE